MASRVTLSPTRYLNLVSLPAAATSRPWLAGFHGARHLSLISGIGQPTQLRRLSQLVAQELRQRILHGPLSDSDRLPPEVELAAELGVSRHHLREALRVLEQEGLVQVRSGRNGGIYLTVPGADVLARTFAGILSRNNASLRDLMEARLIIEPATAGMAATNATEADLQRLERLIAEQERGGGSRPENNSRFHLAIAEAAHNQTLLLTMESISLIIQPLDLQLNASYTAEESAGSQEMHDAAMHAHRAILSALRRHDPEQATARMQAHLRAFDHVVQQRGIDLRMQTVSDLLQSASRGRFGNSPADTLGSERPSK